MSAVRGGRPTRDRRMSAERWSESVELSWAECSAAPPFARRCVARCDEATASWVLPNIPEAIIAFLATASIGAIWSAWAGTIPPRPPWTGSAARACRPGHYRGYSTGASRTTSGTTSPRCSRSTPAAGPVLASELTASGNELKTMPSISINPLWILFLLGDDRCQGIMHGHGGVVLKH